MATVSGWRWEVPEAASGAADTVWFVFLRLRGADGALLSRNACAPCKG